ncbi:Hypothetical predicted protein [Cloeon dipterum]|uniref:Uncharacterized protein n=1 Tax=Cloeon dipterum TaxID=197152 RepID=A0A8S1E1Q6_9INSE|nr:Hypothetical predicted protein [Cloeon dipterum]
MHGQWPDRWVLNGSVHVLVPNSSISDRGGERLSEQAWRPLIHAEHMVHPRGESIRVRSTCSCSSPPPNFPPAAEKGEDAARR